MNKIEAKLLFDFKKSNKKRRLQIANKFGFATAEVYQAYLEGKPYPEGNVSTPTKKVIIHNVIISDASGSMVGNKYSNTIAGIKKELLVFNSDAETTVLHSLFEFVDTRCGIVNPYLDVENPVPSFYGAIGGNTPLWWAIVEVLNKFKSVPKSEKVLVKIFTDGNNNAESGYVNTCKALIKELNLQNFTITFVATERDMLGIIQALDLNESNTLTVENSGAGFEEAYSKSLVATMSYRASAVKNEDVKFGFYKKLVK